MGSGVLDGLGFTMHGPTLFGYPYIHGISLVMLQPFVDLGMEIGQSAAPPVGLPTLASTLYSKRAQPVRSQYASARACNPGLVQ